MYKISQNKYDVEFEKAIKRVCVCKICINLNSFLKYIDFDVGSSI